MLKIELVKAYTFEMREVDIPKPGPGEVLLKVVAVGICGSDIQMYHGKHKYMTYPVVIGHEASGTIAEMGEGVTGFALGDLVTIEPQVTCGDCWPCKIGRFNVCEKLRVMGVHKDGFCQEYATVPAKFLLKCPPGMDPELGALVEPLAVGVGSVRRSGNYHGATMAVVGAGTIGNLVAQAAKAMGVGEVLVTDISEPKLALAKKHGIDHVVNTRDLDLGQVIVDTFGPRKADIIIDAAGTPGSFKSILKAARPSSTIVVTANFKEPVEVELPVLQRQEIALLGHMMYVREDFEDAVRFLAEGRVSMDGIITGRYPVRDIVKAFEYIDAHPAEVMKLVLTF